MVIYAFKTDRARLGSRAFRNRRLSCSGEQCFPIFLVSSFHPVSSLCLDHSIPLSLMFRQFSSYFTLVGSGFPTLVRSLRMLPRVRLYIYNDDFPITNGDLMLTKCWFYNTKVVWTFTALLLLSTMTFQPREKLIARRAQVRTTKNGGVILKNQEFCTWKMRDYVLKNDICIKMMIYV